MCHEGNSSKFHVNISKGACGTTVTCGLVKYAKCMPTGKCIPCKQGEPGCQALANCNIDCKPVKPHGLNGTYRAIEISKSFSRGEFDFTFRDDGVDLMFHPTDDASSGPKWELATVNVSVLEGFKLGSGAMIGFKVTKKSGVNTPELKAAGFDPAVGDLMKGLYATKTGQEQVTAFMYLAFSLPSTNADDKATSFDDGMTKLEFNMVSCKDTGTCDFSSASVSPVTALLNSPSALF